MKNIPEFPANPLNLKRGTVLEAADPICRSCGVQIGQRFPIGFDGEYVRCGGLTWSVDQLVGEIRAGYWAIYGEIDFDKLPPELQPKFLAEIDRLSPCEA